jgi:hypothetical protein
LVISLIWCNDMVSFHLDKKHKTKMELKRCSFNLATSKSHVHAYLISHPPPNTHSHLPPPKTHTELLLYNAVVILGPQPVFTWRYREPFLWSC